MQKFKFEKLRVWQHALEFANEIHLMTRNFPKEELYILNSQIKRAADSIVLNIAEGSTGQSDPQFSKFLGYAIRSGIEVVACLHLGKKRGIITEEIFEKLYDEAHKLLRSIQALRKTLK